MRNLVYMGSNNTNDINMVTNGNSPEINVNYWIIKIKWPRLNDDCARWLPITIIDNLFHNFCEVRNTVCRKDMRLFYGGWTALKQWIESRAWTDYQKIPIQFAFFSAVMFSTFNNKKANLESQLSNRRFRERHTQKRMNNTTPVDCYSSTDNFTTVCLNHFRRFRAVTIIIWNKISHHCWPLIWRIC